MLNKYLFSIRIYYQDLSYNLITQKPKQKLFDLISMIGGTFGLFIGVSFLSLPEIIILLFEIFFVLINFEKY